MSNVFSFTGACGSDAVVRYTASGQAVLSVRVANNVGFGDRQQTLWISCSVWGKKAEGNLKNFLVKGQHVFVSGELTTREYQANDGTTKTSLELNATVLDLVGKKNDFGAPAQDYAPAPPASSSYAPRAAAPQAQPMQPARDNFDAPYDDDIPF